MTGLCGVLRGAPSSVSKIADGLYWTGTETRTAHNEGNVSVCAVQRSDGTSAGNALQPGTAETDDVRVWLWGAVYGIERTTGYRSRGDDGLSAAEFFAARYEQEGPGVLSDLNGSFVGLIHDRPKGRVLLVTDRVASRELFVTELGGSGVAFSTRIQSLARHPEVSPSFDPEYVAEYLACRRSFGTTTPLRDVQSVPPATALTVDTDGGERQANRYWYPSYNPLDRSFSYFVDEFVDRFTAARDDRLGRGRCGVLLSGGSDSRLVISGLEGADLQAYHMSGWMSREARVAERVALVAGVPFEFLRRDPEYDIRALSKMPSLMNLSGVFYQAHADGFIDQIREEVDYLMTGHFGDTLFGGYWTPKRSASFGPLSVSLPFQPSVDTVADVVDALERDAPQYIDSEWSLREVIERNIRVTENGINHHGIEFETSLEAVLSRPIFPAKDGSDPFFRQSLHETVSLRTPLVDNRLLDLYLSMPMDYTLRHRLVDAAVTRLAPDLAAIPHAGRGVPLDQSNFGIKLHQLREKVETVLLGDEERPAVPGFGNGPWMNASELIRANPFVGETIRDNEEVIRELPFLSWDGVVNC